MEKGVKAVFTSIKIPDVRAGLRVIIPDYWAKVTGVNENGL